MHFQIGKYSSGVDAKKAAIEAARGSKANDAALVRWINPSDCPERNRIVFDDSGSMGGYIEDAKKGVVEFLKNCTPNQTAVAVHFMNSGDIKLQSDLIQLALDIQSKRLSTGSTPFFNTLRLALEARPTLTRLVAFTDGSPTDRLTGAGDFELSPFSRYGRNQLWIQSADIIIKIAKNIVPDKVIPIDTVFFGSFDSINEIKLLRYLSDATGGIFLHFDPAKINFKTAFKYLAPVFRAQLTDGSFRAAVESGKKV
jgi:hypothetical protein